MNPDPLHHNEGSYPLGYSAMDNELRKLLLLAIVVTILVMNVEVAANES